MDLALPSPVTRTGPINPRNAGYAGLKLGKAKFVFWCEFENYLAALWITMLRSLGQLRLGRLPVRLYCSQSNVLGKYLDGYVT
jgi:hypothetical protein